MLRKAILIESSSVKGQNDLPGARIDVENWKSFLKSELGGKWTDSEMLVLSKPFSSDLERELNQPAECYCFVAFSGHGSNETIVLNDHFDSYPITSLKPKTLRGAVVVDACRGLVAAKALSFKSDLVALSNSSQGLPVVANSIQNRRTDFLLAEAVRTKSAGIKLNARGVWEGGFSSATVGVVEMYACAAGQAAGEDPNAGGYYTSLLLESVEQWRVMAALGTIHSTKNAHDFAAKKLPSQQTPEYRPSGLAFPFAVKVD